MVSGGESLILAFLDGSRAKLRAVIHHRYPILDASEADDAIQSASLRFLRWASRQRSLGNAKPDETPGDYLQLLLKMARQSALQIIRAKRKGPQQFPGPSQGEDSRNPEPPLRQDAQLDPERLALASQCAQRLPRFFRRLEQDARQAMVQALRRLARRWGCGSLAEEFVFLKGVLFRGEAGAGDPKHKELVRGLCERLGGVTRNSAHVAMFRLRKQWMRAAQEVFGA